MKLEKKIAGLMIAVLLLGSCNPEPAQDTSAPPADSGENNTVAKTDSAVKKDSAPKVDSALINRYAEGEYIFKKHCASCHNLDNDNSIGPGLKGTRDRVPKGDWLYKYVRNSFSVIESGDKYANELHKEYGAPMPLYPKLANEQIDDIFDWIDYKCGKGKTDSVTR